MPLLLIGAGLAALLAARVSRENINKAGFYGLSIGLCVSGMAVSLVDQFR